MLIEGLLILFGVLVAICLFSIASITSPRVAFRLKKIGSCYAIEYKTRVFGFIEFWSTLSDADTVTGEFVHTFPVLFKDKETAEIFMDWESKHGYFPSGYYHKGLRLIIPNHENRRVVSEDEEPKFAFIHPHLNCNMWKLDDSIITHTTLTEQRGYAIDENGRWTKPKYDSSENSLSDRN